MAQKLTGLSLSFCVKDIAAGRIKVEQVEKIIASTCAADSESWKKVLAQYAESYWEQFPAKALEIANQLFDSGKIEQPRVTGGAHPMIGNGHWQDANGNFIRLN